MKRNLKKGRAERQKNEGFDFNIWILEKATRIANEAHTNQKRKWDNVPFITHPFMVAIRLAKYGFSDTILASALTHDVLEDTNYPVNSFREELGEEVYELVKAVSNDPSLPWEEKKLKYIETVRNGPEWAKAIAVADKIHNLETLFMAYNDHWKGIWKLFNKWKNRKIWFEEKVLKMLQETWKHPMVDEYEILLQIEKDLK